MDVYRMCYGGFVAAVLPGFALVFGPLWLLVASVVAGVHLFTSPSILHGLRTMAWYRWYEGLILGSGLAFGAVALLIPDYKAVAAGVWFFAQLAILGGFFTYFQGEPPTPTSRIPRG